MNVRELAPIKEKLDDFEKLETRIKRAFLKFIYHPLLAELELPTQTIKNDNDPLLAAIQSGEVTFTRGVFRGRFTAEITKALKALGAKWGKGVFKINTQKLPVQVRSAISASSVRFEEKLKRIDKKITQILPVEVRTSDIFDKVLWKTDRDLQSSLKNITVTPKISKEQRKIIADEWQTNMDLWIKDFTEKEIVKLRKDIQKAAFSGNRRESLVKSIRKSYGVSESKAKFLARQETSLLMTKFKETRYVAAGVKEYKWGCVAGSPAHPVRPWHKALEGKVFRWDSPPITTAPNEPTRRNNPGQDYNCRCFARPIVRFAK